MRKIIAGLNISLDGFTQGPNGEMDWLNLDKPAGWKDRHADLMQQLKSADTFLLGRVTYQIRTILAGSRDVQWKNTKLIKDNVAEEVTKLKREPGKDILVPGGAGIVSTLTDLGLIDEYNLLVNPVVLGKGKHLFKDVNHRRDLKLVKTRTLDSQIVALTYERRS